MYRHISRLACAVCLLWTVAAQAQTVDEIVAKNLQAKGGAEKWKAVNSVKTTGTITVPKQQLPITVYAKRPNLNRQEIALPKGKVIQAFDGNTAWMVNPMMGITEPQVVPGASADMMKNGADFDGALINYKGKGHTIELVGKETLRDKPVYHLKVTMKGGQVQDYYLDTETGIEVKTTAHVEVDMGPDGPQKQTIETEMSNYKVIDGIMIPHTVRLVTNGKPTMEMSISSVEFITAIDEAMFSMPKK